MESETTYRSGGCGIPVSFQQPCGREGVPRIQRRDMAFPLHKVTSSVFPLQRERTFIRILTYVAQYHWYIVVLQAAHIFCTRNTPKLLIGQLRRRRDGWFCANIQENLCQWVRYVSLDGEPRRWLEQSFSIQLLRIRLNWREVDGDERGLCGH